MCWKESLLKKAVNQVFTAGKIFAFFVHFLFLIGKNGQFAWTPKSCYLSSSFVLYGFTLLGAFALVVTHAAIARNVVKKRFKNSCKTRVVNCVIKSVNMLSKVGVTIVPPLSKDIVFENLGILCYHTPSKMLLSKLLIFMALLNSHFFRHFHFSNKNVSNVGFNALFPKKRLKKESTFSVCIHIFCIHLF